MKGIILVGLILLSILRVDAQAEEDHNLRFDSLARRWDEGIPLGNGWLGALVWQKADKLRLSLDRVDLWDDRPMPSIDRLRFNWVGEQVRKGEYDTVQKMGDEPYEANAAPTKIPGAAIEFDLGKLGTVASNELNIRTGLNTILFQNGIVFLSYIHATRNVGYFGIRNMPSFDISPELVIPGYNSGEAGTKGNSVEGQGLERLGYPKGTITRTAHAIRYHQPTWGKNFYEVLIDWYRTKDNQVIGQWTISWNKTAQLPILNLNDPEPTGWPSHLAWWKHYWNRSSVSLPDQQLEKQYYLEMYKFACVTRANTPPISLQGIWTADNGSLPPWKGDFHHDLNTQLSYWPGYTANHLDLTASYTNWLWKVMPENKRWTKQYFNKDGLNVPGVTTISGKPMGGWIQYSMSPTTAAWLAQHFYWQWKYSMDPNFLSTKAKPYILSVAGFLDKMTMNNGSTRRLALSSSPEYFDNSIKAWFTQFTNYDLALVANLFSMARSVNEATGDRTQQRYWSTAQSTLPDLSSNETGLLVAPGQVMDESHRHFSPYMAIYPLALLDRDVAKEDSLIKRSLRQIERMGTRQWCGYSFSWMACIYASAGKADEAVRQLKIFSSNFVSPNSFHLNGDQRGGEYSSFTYRPFTLEGNFAFAQGVHELLLQTRKGIVEIFPAIPRGWQDVSFESLRTEGAFLISAQKERGVITEVTIRSERGGTLRLRAPFPTFIVNDGKKKYRLEGKIILITMAKGETVTLKNGYE